MMFDDDLKWMGMALEEARAAFEEGEIPIGAVAVFQNRLIARNHNRTEQLKDASRHAEMLVISQSSEFLGRWRLDGVTMYVTIEPCPMCAMAIVLARFERVVFGASEPKTGAYRSFVQILDNPALNHRPSVEEGVMADFASELLKDFFKQRRQGILTHRENSD